MKYLIEVQIMAFCQNCGAKLADGAKFCSGCGEKLNHAVSTPNSTSSVPKNKIVASKYFSGAWVNVAPFDVTKTAKLKIFLNNLPDKNIDFDNVLVFFNGIFDSCGNIGFIITSEKVIGFDKKNQYFDIAVTDISDVSWSASKNIFAPMSDHLKIQTATKQWDLIYGANEFAIGQFCRELKAFALTQRK